LLGDSADHDADFYIEVAKIFPKQIKAIYIRQTRNTKNARRIKKLIQKNTEVPAILWAPLLTSFKYPPKF